MMAVADVGVARSVGEESDGDDEEEDEGAGEGYLFLLRRIDFGLRRREEGNVADLEGPRARPTARPSPR